MRRLADNKRIVGVAFGAFLVILVVGFAIAQGIGDDNPSGDDVAVVDGQAISQEEFDTALLQAAKRQGLQQAPAEDNPQYQVLRDEALGDLFDIAWIQGEAEERGIEATDTEVQDQLQQVKNQSFKTDREYQQFLERSGFTEEDVNLRIELQVLSTKIQEEVAADAEKVSDDDAEKYYEANKANYVGQNGETQPFDEVSEQIKQQLDGQRQQEFFADFLSDYRERWINVTVCADDFLNERCDNFEGAITECTEEQAAQTGCPPPVLSTSPVAPGTILPFTPPAGQAQRPHPPGEDAAPPAVPTGIPGGTPGAVPPGGAAPPGAAPPG